MSTDKNGGPAFPVPLHPGQSYQGHAPCDGMTLRDYFAAKALPAVVQVCGGDTMHGMRQADYFAGRAYELADAMLTARDQT
ncbi:hypothetical protein ACTJNK_29150 [Achromobacter anxifer]